MANRTTAQGYNSDDEIRKQYTGYERDEESGLDFAQARYYNSQHGRFTSVDPLTASASIRNPQTFNRYSYVLNSPYKFTDPLGLLSVNTSACGMSCRNSGPYSTGEGMSSWSAGEEDQDSAEGSPQTRHLGDPPGDTPRGHAARALAPSKIPPSNGNPADEGVDRDLARLFGDEKQKPVVTAANQTGMVYVGEHYVLDNGAVYAMHMYGPTGNENIDVYLSQGFEKPTLSENAHPEANGKYGLVSVNKTTGEVLSFAHVDSIQSQADLDRVWNLNKTNGAGSRYIGTIGTSGGSPGYMHTDIKYYVSNAARERVRSLKGSTIKDIRDPKYFRDLRTLVRPNQLRK